MKKTLVKRDSYFDSVFLMLMSRELKTTPGVVDAIVAMGTEMNLDLLGSMGFAAEELAGAGPNDLLIAVDCADGPALERALEAAHKVLGKKKAPAGGGATLEPASLAAAVERVPANLAVISLPGAYAVREARKALELGLHVMLFSDNVSLDDEIALKALSREKGLLMMGPDCGTAIINGKPLCFANVVQRGPVGVVGASGTGIQEVTCLVDRFRSGISQAIGTGGRDLKNARVGGSTTLMAIEALAQDDDTNVIVVISKPPAKAQAAQVVAALETAGKPAVVHFIGLEPEPAHPGSVVTFATNLEETAGMAVALAEGRPYQRRMFTQPAAEIEAILERETRGILPAQTFIRGYYTGGTLADEAWILLHQLTGAVHSNNQTDPAFVPPDPHKSVGHTVVDLGDDMFTVGRPHPMIDPSTRTDRILAELDDAGIAVVIVDVVLGYGSHEDPAGALAPALAALKQAARARGGYLPVLASITGTQRDFQNFAAQKATLEAAGCVVLPSNYQASMLAVKLLERLGAL
jgi:succinyl-CoA synthetase alpha subunit